MLTSATTKKLAQCASKTGINGLSVVRHEGTMLTATDSFKMVTIDGQENCEGTKYYSAHILKSCAAGVPMDAAVVERQTYPNINMAWDQLTKDAEYLGTFKIDYLIDTLQALKTVSDTVILEKQNAQFKPLVLKSETGKALVMPLNR